MKTMYEIIDGVFPDFITYEQKRVSEYHLTKGANVYIEGPYNCNFHNKQYGYVWVVGKKLLKLDGRGYDVKMQCEIPPKIV